MSQIKKAYISFHSSFSHIIKFKTYALTKRGSFNYLSLIALIPGNSFPSKYSNDAPPPVEI